MPTQDIRLRLRTQVLAQDTNGHHCWQAVTQVVTWQATETALLLCDVWDDHWSRGAAERVNAMAPRMNDIVSLCRTNGMHIIHAPSDTMAFYADSPARQRMLDIPQVEPPLPLEHLDPPLPIDDSDGGSDTGEAPWHKAWTRQHPAIEIDHRCDGVTDSGREVYSYLQYHGIAHLILMGVHTNMCILNRSFAIKQMVRWGVGVVLVRDMTDAMYNPAMSPYVSHQQGTELVIGYIEKFWCPTIHSRDLLAPQVETADRPIGEGKA
jgi:nicotinamidase-related amidase